MNGKVISARRLRRLRAGARRRRGPHPAERAVARQEEDGTPKTLKIGEEVQAEIANIDSQDRRITLSHACRWAAAIEVSQAPKAEKRESRAPKKASSGGSEEAKAGSIGELIKQKLGLQLALDKNAEKKARPMKTDDDDK